jgi:hypothetical protein
MPKRLYTTPSQYWHLPDATDLPTLRGELDAAMETGSTLVLEVEHEGYLAELTIVGSRLGAYSLIDIPLPTEILDDGL